MTRRRRVHPRSAWTAAAAAALAAAGALTLTGISTGRTLAVAGVAAGVAVVVPITRHTRLRDADDDLKASFDQIPLAMYRTLPSGEIVAANQAMADLLGVGDTEALVRSSSLATSHYVDPERRGEWRKLIEGSGTVRDFEIDLVTADGRQIKVVSNATAVYDDAGRVRYYEGALTDVTDLRAAEESRERLARIIDATTDLVAISDATGKITYANRAAREWMQRHVTREAYVHQRQLLTEEQFRRLGEAMATAGEWSGDLVTTHTGVPRYMSVVAQRFEVDGHVSIAAVGRDLTDERSTAAQLESLIRSKDEFVASVSHEIRTPLTTVVGLTAELRDRAVDFDDVERQSLIAIIAEQSQEVADIVEDLLVAARKDTDSVVLITDTLDVAELVETSIRALPPPARASVQSTVTGWVSADGQRVRQIVRNLLTNAVRYGRPPVMVRTSTRDHMVEIEVRDHGSGVPLDLQANIFEPFERAHEVGSQPASVGLGLTISRWLARKMGGDLTYSDADPGGSFRLTLPESQPPASAEVPPLRSLTTGLEASAPSGRPV